MELISITISRQSKVFWESLKNDPSESMEDAVNRILRSKMEEDVDLLTEKDILEINTSIAEIESGNYKTQAQMKEEYGL